MAACKTIKLPLVAPVYEQIKLTIYDSANVNNPKQ